ncbi:malto-oligosyltrehalose trehalohydrolase, partial [Rhodospirillum rubrum]
DPPSARSVAAAPPPAPPVRRLPQGAEVQPGGGVHFRVWAPGRQAVTLCLENGAAIAMTAEDDGSFAALVAEAGAGTAYRYRLEGVEALCPDPLARFQPEGPHGPSLVVDPAGFVWSDQAWAGVSHQGMVLYEMHIGTFTPEGTWAAAMAHLERLRDLGVTCLEIMPIAEFSGRFGWGYDGVNLFAPTRLYGQPDDMRRFVDRAHALGLAVILDVVYNHLGPDGNYLGHFTNDYFTDRYKNDWGVAINFDGPGSAGVRAFYLANAGYWIEEFHLDGLRLDATQQIYDRSEPSILAEIAREVRAAAKGRNTFVVAENEPQEVRLIEDETAQGYGLDALWNDDLHHAAMVALTGRREAYYLDYLGSPQELISAAKWGFLYAGQYYSWQRNGRGTTSFAIPGRAMVAFLQNHDQVANSARGLRLDKLSDEAQFRALTAYLLLIPATPMLFQGQEFRSSAPFYYFADHGPKLAAMVKDGRADFLTQFPSIDQGWRSEDLPDPAAEATFERCKLDHREWQSHAEWVALHRDLLTLRRETPAFAAQDCRRMEGAVLGPQTFVLRFFAEERLSDRLMLVNLGPQITLTPMAEPLLAPPMGKAWTTLWASSDQRYGGAGLTAVERTPLWEIPARTTVVLGPGEKKPFIAPRTSG